ncbi:MAG: cell division protein FtsA [Ignavibacteriales bacterium]|nr:cell division protein FtsA [Ignavibacteriales bacterium]
MKENIITGLDLGTTKVCALIAEKEENRINILGFGIAPNEGLNRGLVANIAKTAEAISEAMKIATNRAGISIKDVTVGVAGEHIKSIRHRNYITISNPDKEITQEDLDRLQEDVKTIRKPAEFQILHIIPEEYIVDYQGGIDNPIGMCGSKLEAVNHIIMASDSALRNIKKSVERAGYNVNNLILQPIASGLSVLEDNEKDLGTALIDIGGGTTDVAIFYRNCVKYTKVFGVAGNHVTNDIREALGIVRQDAENMKKEFGYADQNAIIKDEDIFIKGIGARGNIRIPISLLTQIISVRMRELFMLVDNELKNSQFKNKLKAGIVLTGGGSLLKGCVELAEEVFGIPARIGVPLDLGGGLSNEIESPEFATVAGLIKRLPGTEYEDTIIKKGKKEMQNKTPRKNVFRKLKEFFDEL